MESLGLSREFSQSVKHDVAEVTCRKEIGEANQSAVTDCPMAWFDVVAGRVVSHGVLLHAA